MKFKIMLIGIALLLALCINPVAAVSGDDFEIVIDTSDDIWSYKYRNVNDPDEKYTEIHCGPTIVLYSLVTFEPVGIPGAPRMVVDTNHIRHVYLPQSVDDWEIKYYSRIFSEPSPSKKYLKNAGVVNLNEYFRGYIENGLNLVLSTDQCICPCDEYAELRYYIPDVNEEV